MRKAITTLWVVAAALLLFGLVIVYSASSAQKGGPIHFFKMQAVAAVCGTIAAIVLSRIDYRFWNNAKLLVFVGLVCVAFCSLVFLFPKVNGSRRWVYLAGISLQPSEFARIGLVMVLSAWYDRIGPRAKSFVRGVLIPGAMLALIVGPVVASPDLGATLVMCVAAGTVIVAAGVKWHWIGLGAVAALALIVVLVMVNPNKRSRMVSYFDSLQGRESTEETSYHQNQSIEAFVRGGWKGVGLGKSIQKHRYLPEANSDFIYAIAAEEFGIFATLSMVIAFSIMLWCGVYIAFHAADRFGRFMAMGLTVLVTFEAAFNMGMVTGCLPTKGIALPFTSAGGTSLLASMIAFGLLLSVGMTSADEETAPLMRNAEIEF